MSRWEIDWEPYGPPGDRIWVVRKDGKRLALCRSEQDAADYIAHVERRSP